jgi:3',5'-nucleoside bisphosphate phosphatase
MIDLHVHSNFSDGTMTPEELVKLAKQTGLNAIALTDHDTTGGIERFTAACIAEGIRGVPGVEISADIEKGALHMLGYFIQPEDKKLIEFLRHVREGRDIRNQEIMRKLNILGMELTWDDIKGFAKKDFVGRLHFAQALVARGYARDRSETFERWLSKGKPAYVERFRLSPEDSIRLIVGAGGLPVLAHPFTLKLNSQQLRDYVRKLRDIGLQGLEVYYPDHTTTQMREYGAIARDLEIIGTGGTDFHGASIGDVRLGAGRGSLKVPDRVLDELMARLVA